MKTIKHAGIVVKPHAPGVERVLTTLIGLLEKRGTKCLLEKAASKILGRPDGQTRDSLPAKTDLIVVLGGDGTLLSIAHQAAKAGVPVLGVNMGRLGFLTEVPVKELPLALEAFYSGNRDVISSRALLEVRCGRSVYLCLNDAVINKGVLARMIQLTIKVDDKEVATAKADGLIVATPTGSTAYSLSAGGPILQPNIPAIVIAPICPHALTFRPMVISSKSTVKVRLLTGGEEVYLTLDGQRGCKMKKSDIVKIRRSPYELQLISSPKRNYFDLLQEKLGWAE
jgi:NAD+ kinase